MSRIRYLGVEDLKALVEGSTFLGCGGGGSPDEGLNLLMEAKKMGLEVKIVEIDDVPEDAILASPYYVGPLSREYSSENLALRAFNVLEEYLNRNFYAVVPTELGGHNTAVAVRVAAEKGIPVVDGDLAGRAVPELHHSSAYVHGYNMAPFSVVTSLGDEILFRRIAGDEHAERLIRSIVSSTGRKVGITSHPFSAKIYQRILVRNTLTRAIKIGRILRNARKVTGDFVFKLQEIGAELLFKGKIVKLSYEEKGGFSLGKFEMEGVDEFSKERYEVFFRNENLFSLRNGKLDRTLPDLICIVSEDGKPVTNADLIINHTYLVFGMKAPQIWTTEKGKKILYEVIDTRAFHRSGIPFS